MSIEATRFFELLDALDQAIASWDDTYPKVLQEFADAGEKVTEERLKIKTRNRMREDGMELPEIARWKLRFAVGWVEEHE